jgi:tRNA nucleotidyltransferase (CCA-adding enzyme)
MPAPEADELAARMLEHPRIARIAQALAPVPGCWLVGGAVRDLLLGIPPVDLDVVVEGDAADAAEIAGERLAGRILRHERFGTATVEADDLSFDLATARRESYPRPGALPEVEPAPLDEDLARRDFTVNALAAAVSRERLGELRAAPAGLEDLSARRLRVLHERSFLDDPTRLLRLVRYGARLGFSEEPVTATLAREAIAERALAAVSGPRVAGELMLLLREPEALEALRRAEAMRLDRALHPRFHAHPDLARRALDSLPPGARRDLTLLATCVTALERRELRDWLERLGLTASERDALIAAALDAPDLARSLSAARRPSEVAALARDRPPEQLAIASALGAGAQVEAWIRELSRVGLEITGDDLIAAGLAEGPLIGRALEAALAEKLDGGPGGRDAELRAALRAAGMHGGG